MMRSRVATAAHAAGARRSNNPGRPRVATRSMGNTRRNARNAALHRVETRGRGLRGLAAWPIFYAERNCGSR